MNNKYLFSSILFLIIQTLIAQEFAIGIIPSPNKISILKGIFEINNQTTIRCNSKTKDISILIQSYLKKESKLNLKITHDKKNKKNSILLKIDSQLEKEAYSLNSSKNGIIITGATKAGLFYGFQTLKQLFINSTQIPIVSIKDSPRFKWRAYMLDEARYFHGEEFVKKMLDQMALLKMNVFHWHLTDDAGWRIEIKKYPKLTEIGATRSDSEIGTWKSGKTAGKPHRGFYTQQQIKEIVAYAAKRYITIVPEFEMPGHSSAAIAAYPWLGTVGKAMDVPIKFGRHYDNYDITKPEVEAFVKDVLSELFDLFPSKVIHVGGDEVGYASWNNSKHVQQYMKEKKPEYRC